MKVLEGLGGAGVALLEEVCNWDKLCGLKSPQQAQFHSLSLCLQIECGSQHPACLPSQ